MTRIEAQKRSLVWPDQAAKLERNVPCAFKYCFPQVLELLS